jgi:hypothetical protein
MAAGMNEAICGRALGGPPASTVPLPCPYSSVCERQRGPVVCVCGSAFRLQLLLADGRVPVLAEVRDAAPVVALAQAWASAWSAVTWMFCESPRVIIAELCEAAMFQANASMTPSSTGRSADSSPVRPRRPGSRGALIPRCIALPLRTGTEATSVPGARGCRSVRT